MDKYRVFLSKQGAMHPNQGTNQEPYTNRNGQDGKAAIPLLIVLVVLLMGVSGTISFLFIQEREVRQVKERELMITQAERDDYKVQLEEAMERELQMQADLDEAHDELVIAQSELADAIEAREVLARSVDDREKEIGRLGNDLEQAKKAQKSFDEQLLALKSERDDLTDRLSELERAQKDLGKNLAKKDRKSSVELDKVVVSNEPSRQFQSMDAFAVTQPVSALSSALSGEVIVINREYDFVVMNIGKSQGLSIGQEFHIVRDNAVLGTVKVEKVYDDLSAAAILPNVDKEFIREGDAVISL